MIHILRDLIMLYIVPLLKFAGIYIDDDGYLKPIGAADNMVFQYNGKDIIVAKHDLHYQMIQDKREKYELFNPFVVPRHMVFVANLILAHINQIDPGPIQMKKKKSTEKLIYDEDIDDYIPVEGVEISNEEAQLLEVRPKIEMKHAQSYNGELNTITIEYVDVHGNPYKDLEPLSKYMATDPIVATFGAILNLIKKYQKRFPLELMDTDVAVIAITKGITRFLNERRKYKLAQEETVKMLDLTIEENVDQAIAESSKVKFDEHYLRGEYPDVEFIGPWTKSKDLNFDNPDSILYHNMISPRFKIVEDENMSFGEILMKSQYDDILLSSD